MLCGHLFVNSNTVYGQLSDRNFFCVIVIVLCLCHLIRVFTTVVQSLLDASSISNQYLVIAVSYYIG